MFGSLEIPATTVSFAGRKKSGANIGFLIATVTLVTFNITSSED